MYSKHRGMRWTCFSLRLQFELFVTEALELSCSKDRLLSLSKKDRLLSTGVVMPTKLSGGSSGDEKSELSKVDRDTHSSK